MERINDNINIESINVDPQKVLPGVVKEKLDQNSLIKKWKYLKILVFLKKNQTI